MVWVACMVDNFIVLFGWCGPSYNYTWVSSILRPIYLLLSIRMLRETMTSYLGVIYDTLPMVSLIVIFILYYSWLGQRIFSGTLEGVTYYSSFSDSVWNMLVLMTTSNFPDVMLPAYHKSRMACIYFITYMVLVYFLMMNLLLATFYSTYKSRFERKIEDTQQRRSDYLYKLFTEIANGKDMLFCRVYGLANLSNVDINEEDRSTVMSRRLTNSRRLTVQQRQHGSGAGALS
jgi:hypothetical protein